MGWVVAPGSLAGKRLSSWSWVPRNSRNLLLIRFGSTRAARSWWIFCWRSKIYPVISGPWVWDTLPPIIMVPSKMGVSPIGSFPFKYSHFHPFSTEPWLWEKEYVLLEKLRFCWEFLSSDGSLKVGRWSLKVGRWSLKVGRWVNPKIMGFFWVIFRFQPSVSFFWGVYTINRFCTLAVTLRVFILYHRFQWVAIEWVQWKWMYWMQLDFFFVGLLVSWMYIPSLKLT